MIILCNVFRSLACVITSQLRQILQCHVQANFNFKLEEIDNFLCGTNGGVFEWFQGSDKRSFSFKDA